MKIQSVEITNYKAFLGTYTLKFGGKNVFIYGENGSGKSSLYYALKDFFQSSAKAVRHSLLERRRTWQAHQRGTAMDYVYLIRSIANPEQTCIRLTDKAV